MKNTFKKITASVIAATILSVGMIGMSANAAVQSYNWTTRCVSNAPGSASTTDSCSLSYSTYGANVYCSSVSNTATGGSGYTHVNCTNYTMSEKTVYAQQTIICKPIVSGIITGVSYKFSAYTATSYNTFVANGNIAAKTTP